MREELKERYTFLCPKKQKVRQKVWDTLEKNNLVSFPRPCYNRIPNFIGSKDASQKIKNIPEFKGAGCVFCAPDSVLKHIRMLVLKERKVLAVALPNMLGFCEIKETEFINEATSIKGFTKFGRPLRHKVDLFVQGSVAVDKSGNRLGKGKGYGDKEWAWLLQKELIRPDIKVVTIVHDQQIVDDFTSLVSKEDKKVDYIITPTKLIRIP